MDEETQSPAGDHAVVVYWGKHVRIDNDSMQHFGLIDGQHITARTWKNLIERDPEKIAKLNTPT